MLGVLIEVFRRDPVAAGLRLPRQRDITFEYLIGVAANFHARPVAVEGLDAMRQARSVVVVMRTTATGTATSTTAAATSATSATAPIATA
jgi:hypothetical protein